MKLIIAIVFVVPGIICAEEKEDEALREISFSKNMNAPAMQDVPDLRIIGGSAVASRTECPYMASLHWRTEIHICGAIILDKANVLTSAHCVKGLQLADLSIKTGILQLEDTEAISVNISKIVIHESYNATANIPYNDIAILHLKSNLTLGPNVAPIALSGSRPSVNADCTVYGWGVTNSSWPISSNKVLNKAQVKIISDETCRLTYGNTKTAEMVCASGTGADACTGDLGGPLVNGNSLVGIVSYPFHNLCAHVAIPRIYTDVAKYTAWIQTNKQETSSANGFTINSVLLLFVTLFLLWK